MTVKNLVFRAQAALKAQHRITAKRSHLYEILAALFSYGSHAALSADALYAQTDGRNRAPIDQAAAVARARQCGHSPDNSKCIVSVLREAAGADRICVATLADVLEQLQSEKDDDLVEDVDSDGDDSDDDEDPPTTRSLALLDLSSPVLLEGLEAAAQRGNADAHFALALLLDDSEEEEEDELAPGLDGSYWYEERRAGRDLTGPQLSWALSYEHAAARRKEAKIRREAHVEHIRLAAGGGNVEAAVRLAELCPDEHSLYLAMKVVGPTHALRLARIAAQQGRNSEQSELLRMAATNGDIDAMHELAQQGHCDAIEAWTWVYLAGHLGYDLQRVEAIHEDGTPYDDDVGGTAFPVGGIDLPRLSVADEAAARQSARVHFERLSHPSRLEDPSSRD